MNGEEEGSAPLSLVQQVAGIDGENMRGGARKQRNLGRRGKLTGETLRGGAKEAAQSRMEGKLTGGNMRGGARTQRNRGSKPTRRKGGERTAAAGRRSPREEGGDDEGDHGGGQQHAAGAHVPEEVRLPVASPRITIVDPENASPSS